MEKSTNLKQIFGRAVLVFMLIVCLLGILMLGKPSKIYAQANTPVPTKMANITISVIPESTSVNIGQEFDVEITIASDSEARGAQFELRYDPNLVEILSLTEGNFFRDWAEQNGASTIVVPEPVPDNERGVIPTFGIALLGARPGTGGVSGSGVIMVLHAKAKQTAGNVEFSLGDVAVADYGDDTGRTASYGGVKIQNAVVAIGGESVAQPESESVPTPTSPPVFLPTVDARVITPESSAAETSSSGGTMWLIALPVAGLLIGGAVIFFAARQRNK
jgi:hypothetical protein